MNTSETNLTHFDASGNAVMVDVSEKTVTFREGMELGEIHLVEKTGGKSGHYIRAEGGYV